MISDKNFKLKKSTKRMVALMKGASTADRNQFKRMMIDAQVSEESARRQALKSKDSKSFKDAE